MKEDMSMEAAMEDCIDWCNSAHSICTEAVAYCLTMGGEYAAAPHIRLLLDCAQICRTSADFMLRESDLHGLTCETAAEICERCAEACARFEDDELMQACAETCRTCADSCREMARLARAA